VGNWFTRPEGLDAVEIVIRMEEKYELQISDQDAESMETMGQTVRYL
jgi:acyl carrier protein